jgi:PPE-repeat protein
VLDFGMLPPEINSGRMYSGPGSGPMLAAAAAWDALAGELSSAAAGYGSVIAELTSSQWLGPASMAMAKAAAPYVTWLHGTAAQAEHTSAQAKEIAAAYELAFSMTVPPPVIAANRSLLMTLVATNFLGQNTPAIATTEAHYTEMWVQDAVAMYGYAGSSATASRLAPFTEPQSTTNPAGLAAQSGAVAHATSTAAGNQQTTLSQLISAMPTALQQLAAPAASSDPPSASTVLSVGLSATKFVNTAVSSSSSATSGRGIFIVNERLAFQAVRDLESPPRSSGILTSAAPFRLGRSAVSAAVGRATPVGSLSAPPSWATAAPEIRPVALALPNSGTSVATGTSGDAPPVPGSAFSQAVLGTLSRNGFDVRHPKSRPIIVRSPAAG